MIDVTQLLASDPMPPGIVLRALPPGSGQEWHLVRQVQALANAVLDGPRGIVFGAEHGAGGRPVVAGVTGEQRRVISTQHALLLRALDPAPALELAEGEIAGRPVVALMLADTQDPPYMTTSNAPAPLQAGECWLFTGNELRAATRADLDTMYATRGRRSGPLVLVGLGDDPHCDSLDLRIPDVGLPPSLAVAAKLKAAIGARQTVAAALGREDTAIGRLVDARVFGADARYDPRGIDTLRQSLHKVPQDFADADLYHRYERGAVKLNLAVCVAGGEPLSDVSLELTVPELPGFSIAQRLVGLPGKPPDQRGYPEVRREQGCVKVLRRWGELTPGQTVAAFRVALRCAVAADLVGKKLAVRYSLKAGNLAGAASGRLRIRFAS